MAESRWYVVRVKARQETIAEENLARQGYRVWLPQISLQRRRRGKWRPVVEPLFPGYLFVQLQPGVESYAPIRSTRGVTDLVRFADEPIPMPGDIVEGLRLRQEELEAEGSSMPFQPGDKLHIVDGAFSGWEGVYALSEGEDRITLLLEILGKEQRLSVRKNDVISL
jgi:transcriptional antiterminator RfaH